MYSLFQPLQQKILASETATKKQNLMKGLWNIQSIKVNLICLHPQPVSERTLHPARERAHDNLNKTALISHTAQVLKNSLNTPPAKKI